MPTYEYECAKCGHRFERFQLMSEEPVKRCPRCRGKVRRLFGPGAGIIFKGSGFYETDYRSASYREAVRKETATGEETKSDVKKKQQDTAGGERTGIPAKPAARKE